MGQVGFVFQIAVRSGKNGGQPALQALGGKVGDLPVSERISREVLSLPLYAEMPLEDVRRVAGEVRSFCRAALAQA